MARLPASDGQLEIAFYIATDFFLEFAYGKRSKQLRKITSDLGCELMIGETGHSSLPHLSRLFEIAAIPVGATKLKHGQRVVRIENERLLVSKGCSVPSCPTPAKRPEMADLVDRMVATQPKVEYDRGSFRESSGAVQRV